MSQYLGTSTFHHGTAEKLGILVTNLGTPDAPETGPLRRYLAEFLWDPRVVEVPRPLWWLILHGVILRIRPSRSAEAYRGVWTEDGSPLLTHARAQAHGLRERLAPQLSGPVEVALGMRYGNPSIASALRQLHALNVTRLLVLPLYPQYSASTTGSTFDAVAAELMRWRWVPELRFVGRYHEAPGYIEALAASIREHWAEHGRGEHLLMSFHGVPRRYLDSGDPYHCQCHKTARLVAEALDRLPTAELNRYLQGLSLPEDVAGELVFEISVNDGNVGRVILDDRVSTMSLTGTQAELITIERVVRSLQSWRFQIEGDRTIRLTLRVKP